jgi:membrane protein implicated in regulation of membrane protease activity
MSALALIISIIALILAVSAYQRTGGEIELKKRLDELREKTADLLEEGAIPLKYG